MMEAQQMPPSGEPYLERIDALRQEIGVAMATISSNKLQAFEESLGRQEVLCVGLKHLLAAAHGKAPGSLPGPRLQSSLQALHQVNQAYAELLRQARASNHLLYALFQTRSTHPRELAGPTGTRCSLEV